MNIETPETPETPVKETSKEIKSGTTAIHLCGDDYSRIDEFVEELATELGFLDIVEKKVMTKDGEETIPEEKAAIVEWNYGYGLVDFKTRAKTGKTPNDEKISFAEFLETYKNTVYARNKIILIRNARHVLEGETNRENLAQLQQTIVQLKKKLPGKAVLIYCDEKKFVPDELSSLVYFLDVKPPSRDELAEITRAFINKKSFPKNEKLVSDLSSKCVGMNKDSFKQVLEKAALEKDFAENVIPLAEKTKKQFVDKSGLLKYVNVEVEMKNVGGLGHLKWWLGQKEKAFNDPDKAKEMGISPAKGILLVGMPGCGKSLTSKAVANFFNLPLLSLDLGSLMGKYLGESEENLRRALKLAENSSPCVLWVDEIEKAFAGVGGDESGVSQRLLGYLLTWLNDKTARVFVMATANDVAVLPPEFLRRGRFDEIFYVDFPNAPERKHIFRIHLEKRLENRIKKEKLNAIFNDENNKKQFEELTRDKKPKEKAEDEAYTGTEGYAGSDIEALVNSAIERAWNKKENVETEIFRLLIAERKYMTPLKEVLAEKIERNREKFGQYKLTSASEDEKNLRRFETDSEGTKEDKIKTAKDEQCPVDILIKLAKDDNKEVKLAVLDNPNCPSDCFTDLMKDKDTDPKVKKKAEDNYIKTDAGMIWLAQQTGKVEQKLNLFKGEIPEKALEYLANDADHEVVIAVFNNRPLESIRKILFDRARNDDELRKKVLARPNCPDNTRAWLQRNCHNCESSKDTLFSGLVCKNYWKDLIEKPCSDSHFCNLHRFSVEKRKCKDCTAFSKIVEHEHYFLCGRGYYFEKDEKEKNRIVLHYMERNCKEFSPLGMKKITYHKSDE